MTTSPRFNPVTPYIHELPPDPSRGVHVPVRVVADAELLERFTRDHSVQQLINVTSLPGLVDAVYGMPDMHEGYGFPVGGVAATLLPDGVISPGGIGFDINCGVRLLTTNLEAKALEQTKEQLVHEISRSIPSGFGRGGRWVLDDTTLERLLEEGCPYLVREHHIGTPEDLDFIESGGHLEWADAAMVSDRAKNRGRDQLGTLGGGNHFLEVQEVEAVFDEHAARRLRLAVGQVTVLIHTGSRGLGHQVCTDYVRLMDRAMAVHGITVPDRQLACAPLSSPEGRQYFAAMAAAAHFAWCNRQTIAHRIRQVFERFFSGCDVKLVYDVGHNIAKLEPSEQGTICVHRKGATRAFGPSSQELPTAYRDVGQPVFIPGSMGTGSFVLVGTDASRQLSLSSTCHGAGRALSRSAAKRRMPGHEVRKELAARGIVVRCPSNAELAEEAPFAYKDVDHVVDVVHAAGIARKVARLRPLGVVKG